MEAFNSAMLAINGVLWHDYVLFTIVMVGLLFTVWSGFCQFRSVTHGFAVVRGKYDDPNDPGAISHFQALSAALSATVGLGNIGGVALAIALGGPGAVFWMWVIGIVGMAIKFTEVTLSMLYRNTDDPENPHGGPMWVAARGFARKSPDLAWFGRALGILFCITLLTSGITGGNMFQAWNVADITRTYFGVPGLLSGIILAILVGSVILGGIKRIGRVAGTLVPLMVALYLIAGTFVLFVNASSIPAVFLSIFTSAFSTTEGTGAFLGGTMGFAILVGMKRAVFSSEAGQGSSPVAHSAAKTDEPAREGIVAGLEPFIDTLVVCTFTSLVILSTGVWNRAAEANYASAPAVLPVELGQWSVEEIDVPTRSRGEWVDGARVFMIYEGDDNPSAGGKRHRISGELVTENGRQIVRFGTVRSDTKPALRDTGLYGSYIGASLTARAFDSAHDGLGKWLVTIAVWLFALSTIISWSYYGEQSVVFLAGDRAVLPFKVIYCLLIVLATAGFVTTDAELDNVTGLGTGVTVWVNIPIMLLFGYQAMKAYKNYISRLKSGELDNNDPAPTLDDILAEESR
ncbi:MAG: alanine/glycine:cation symporter family protein [Gammaproteobacteria bacterium]